MSAPRPDRSSTERRARHDRAVVALLAVLIAFLPLSTDLYLPTLPGLAAHFAVSPAAAQVTLSVFIGGFALTQLLAGPLSDRFGRRPVVLGGATAYLAGSVLAALAGSLDVLLVGRALQAVGACCTVVCARAILRDRFDPAMGARRLAQAMSWVALMPITAPVIGGFVFVQFGWRAAFWMMAAFALAALVACARLLRESHLRPDRAAMRPGPMLANYVTVMRSPAWLAFTLIGTAMYWALFAFLSESSFVFTTLYGLSPTAFGLAVSTITTGFLVGTLTARRVLPRVGIQRTLTLATSIAAGAGLLMLALVLAGVDHLAATLAPQFVFVFAHGLSQSAWQAGSVAPFARQAGAAAALTGFVQNVVAAGVALLTGVLHDGTVLPMAAMCASGGLAALLVAHTLVRRHGGVDATLRPAQAAAPGAR
jgi:DHA1 family bicyclomycin/chloramphenicol resistance-like MFS transporter